MPPLVIKEANLLTTPRRSILYFIECAHREIADDWAKVVSLKTQIIGLDKNDSRVIPSIEYTSMSNTLCNVHNKLKSVGDGLLLL